MRYIGQIIKAAPGFEVCPKCNGQGCYEGETSIVEFVEVSCNICNGKGEVDWVTFLRYPNKNKKEIE
jgi:DnaJ-class molecular chaperone